MPSRPSPRVVKATGLRRGSTELRSRRGWDDGRRRRRRWSNLRRHRHHSRQHLHLHWTRRRRRRSKGGEDGGMYRTGEEEEEDGEAFYMGKQPARRADKDTEGGRALVSNEVSVRVVVREVVSSFIEFDSFNVTEACCCPRCSCLWLVVCAVPLLSAPPTSDAAVAAHLDRSLMPPPWWLTTEHNGTTPEHNGTAGNGTLCRSCRRCWLFGDESEDRTR